jgi:uncharacterized protein (DUF885 family)
MTTQPSPTTPADGLAPGAPPTVADPLPTPARPFERALHAFLVDFFAADPIAAGFAGYHLFDDRWPDLSGSGRGQRLAMLARHETAVSGLAEEDLSAAERIDRALLLEEIEQLRFTDEVLRDEAWDPLHVVYLLGSGLFTLLAREYAPWPQRGEAFLRRVEALPRVLEDALAALTGLPDRPVSRLHLDTALDQLPGIGDLIDEGMAEARRRAGSGEAPGLPEALEVARARAQGALDAFRHALDTQVRGRASGEGRLGADLFARKLRFALSSDLAPEALRERAWRDHRAVRAEMLRLARELWPAWIAGEPLPEVVPGDAEGEERLVRRVLDAIATVHRAPDELIEWCRAEVARIEDFCRERGLITLADEPLKVVWTPRFMRAYGRAFLDSPGPLDRGQSSHFFITPPDEALGPEATESYLREDNDRMLRLMCIHEGVPGHYLQLAASNHSPSLVRTIFSNGMFAEGWAVYVEQVMLDEGYGVDDPALLLTHWKFYLRAITNAILDVETHANGMTEADAIDLMVRQGFQESDEARAKWLRARLTSTQLSTYYVGCVEMYDLELEARRRAAVAAGGSAADVPAPALARVIQPTPGFDLRAHLESVIGHGSPPIRWIRRILQERSGGTTPGPSAA